MRQFAWTFPAGKKTIQKSAAPVAGNVNTTVTVPTGKIWLITNVNIALTTDVTVANRYPNITTRDILDVAIFNNAGSVVTASLTETRYFIMYLTTTGALRNALGFCLLVAGEDLLIGIGGGVAGDSYDYLVEYLEIDAP